MYLEYLKNDGKSVNYLVAGNTNNDSYLLAGRIAAKRNAYIIGLDLSDPEYPQYGNEMTQCDEGCWNGINNVDYVKNELIYARRIYNRNPDWTIINVTNKPIEEIASEILIIVKSQDVP